MINKKSLMLSELLLYPLITEMRVKVLLVQTKRAALMQVYLYDLATN